MARICKASNAGSESNYEINTSSEPDKRTQKDSSKGYLSLYFKRATPPHRSQ